MPGLSSTYYSGQSVTEYYEGIPYTIGSINIQNIADARLLTSESIGEVKTTEYHITGTGNFYGSTYTYTPLADSFTNSELIYKVTGSSSGFAGTGLIYVELSGKTQSGVFGVPESGTYITGDNQIYYVADSGYTTTETFSKESTDNFLLERSSLSDFSESRTGSFVQSREVAMSFDWSTFNPLGDELKDSSDDYSSEVRGYKVFVQSRRDGSQNLNWKEITKTQNFTGFYLTGSGNSFAGTGSKYTYYVTGAVSGFGGQNGFTGRYNGTGSFLSGPFTYVQTESVWAIKESGFAVDQNTYIQLTGDIYGVPQSGYVVFSKLHQPTSIDLTTGLQRELLSDGSTGINVKVIGFDSDNRAFTREASINIIPPSVSNAPEKLYARQLPTSKNYNFALTESTITDPNEASDYSSALSIFNDDPRGESRLADWSDVTGQITGAEEYTKFMNVLGLTGQDMFFVSWQDTDKTYNNSNIYHWDRDWGDRSFWIEVGTGSIPSIVHDSADFGGDKRFTLSSYPDTLKALVYFPKYDQPIKINEISSVTVTGDKVKIPIDSVSSSTIKVYASSGKHFEPFDHTGEGIEYVSTIQNATGEIELYLPPNRIDNDSTSGYFYKIIPEDIYGTGQAAYITGRTQTSAKIRNFSVSEINPGADPEFQVNWSVYDYSNSRFENDYYTYAIQTFNPPISIPDEVNEYPVKINGPTGFGHGLKQFFITGAPSGFAGATGVTGYIDGSGVSGELTYELYSPHLHDLGIDVYGVADFGFSTISNIPKIDIDRNLFTESEVEELKYSLPNSNLNSINLRAADLNLNTRDLGFILFTFDSKQNVVERSILTGSLSVPSITGLTVDNSISRSLDFDFGFDKTNIIKTEVFTGDSSSFIISADNQVATLSSNQTSFTHEPRLIGQPPEVFSSTYYYKFLPYDNFGTGNLISAEAIVQVPNVDSPLLISQDAFETTGINGLDISEVFVRWTGDERVDRYDIEISEKQHPEKIIKSSVGSSDPQLRFNINHGDEHVINISGYLDYPDRVFTKTLKVLATGLEPKDLKIRKDLNLSSENQKDFFINSSGFGLSGQAPYEVNLQLGSGNFIKSKKSSPGSISIVSTDIENESKELLFTNTSGFGTNLTGTVNITLGDSNKIASDGAGNISFQSTGEAGESKELFSITSDITAPSVFKSDIELHMESGVYGSTGFKLQFGSFNHNSDPIFFSRYDVASESSQLRLYIGDNYGNSSDKFAIGAVAPGTTDFNSDFQPILTVAAHGGIGINKSGPTKALEVEKSSNSDSIVKIQNTNLYGGGVDIETETSQANSRPALKINGDFYIGASGSIILDYNKLPTSDPNVTGQIYRDSSNFLKISAG